MCAFIKDIGRRLPLKLKCTLHQGQQGDVNQPVLGNYKTHFLSGTKSDSCGGNIPEDAVMIMCRKKMLDYIRDQREGTHRSGEGEGGAAMWPWI